MNFEKVREKRLSAVLAAGLAAIAMTGCGNESTIKSIRVPSNAIDLGDNAIDGAGAFGGYKLGRSFVVSSDEAKLVYCGGVISTPDPLIGEGEESEAEEQDFIKEVHSIENGQSQVDCIYDDWYMNYDEIQENMVVERFKTK